MFTVTLSPNGVDRYQGAQPPDALLVGTVDGVVELRCSSGRWREMGRGLGGAHVSSLALGDGDRVYAGSHDRGLHRRTDDRWSPFADGIASENVYSLARYGETIYAGTEPALLFRLRDGATAWEELPALRTIPGRDGWNFPAKPHVAHVKNVAVDPRDPATFYVSVEQGALLKTIDGGRTFRQLPFRDESYVYNSDAHRVAINPLQPDELYLSGGDGVTLSADAGETWKRVTTPEFRVGYPDATFCSPLEDGVVFTAGAGGRPHSWRTTGDARAAVARSRDRGATWELLPIPTTRGNIEAVTLVSTRDGYGFFAGTTDGEIFASGDRGASWSVVATGLPAISKGPHANTVLAGRTTTAAS